MKTSLNDKLCRESRNQFYIMFICSIYTHYCITHFWFGLDFCHFLCLVCVKLRGRLEWLSNGKCLMCTYLWILVVVTRRVCRKESSGTTAKRVLRSYSKFHSMHNTAHIPSYLCCVRAPSYMLAFALPEPCILIDRISLWIRQAATPAMLFEHSMFLEFSATCCSWMLAYTNSMASRM